MLHLNYAMIIQSEIFTVYYFDYEMNALQIRETIYAINYRSS